MGKIIGFIMLVIGGMWLAKAIAPMHANLLYEAAQTKRQEQLHPAPTSQEPSLQDLIHEEVLEGKKGLPRMNADGLWLISVDEAQNQIIHTYEFVGIPPNTINSSVLYEIRQEVATRFRISACRHNYTLQLLQRGMSLAQIYKLSETNQEILTLVLSIRDC